MAGIRAHIAGDKCSAQYGRQHRKLARLALRMNIAFSGSWFYRHVDGEVFRDFNGADSLDINDEVCCGINGVVYRDIINEVSLDVNSEFFRDIINVVSRDNNDDVSS